MRDNALLGVHGDVSVRKRRAREPNLVAPSQSGLLTPLRELPDNWTVASLSKLLANAQYRNWNDECNPPLLSPRTLAWCRSSCMRTTCALCGRVANPRNAAWIAVAATASSASWPALFAASV